MITSRRCRARAALPACLLLAVPVAWADQPPAAIPTAQSLIEAARNASGGPAWDRLTTTRDHGTVSGTGLTGTYDDTLDWVHVRQASSYMLGPASGAQGWDGKIAWTMDASRQVRMETSAQATASAVQQAYFSTYALYFPKRYPAEIVYAGPRTADGVTYQAIKVTPHAADPVELWFDPATHLVTRLLELTGAQPHTTLFGDYRAVSGVKLPFHTVVRTADDPKYDLVADMQQFAPADVPDTAFAPPSPPAYDAAFPSGKTSVTVPFKLLNNHIYLLASINGHPPTPFVFDTGATNYLFAARAKALGVKPEGGLPGGGFGNQVSAVGLAKVSTVSIGGLALHDQVFATSDMSSWLAVEGTDSDGLLGYEFVKRAVVTIDYAKRKITFTKPDAFQPPANVDAVPLTFDAHIPVVAASVDGVAGQFEIDTGSRAALTLMHPFTAANHLMDKYRPTRMATTGYGVGGPSKALLARVAAITIGSVTLNNVVADISTDTRGAAADEHTSGNIGGDILKRFTLTLDYGHQKLYLQPNPLAAEPGVFDRSGLWVNRAADGMIAIADISANSAATTAGLKVGDTILAVNGDDSRTVELDELRQTFKRKPGTVVRLLVRRADGKVKSYSLTLQNQV